MIFLMKMFPIYTFIVMNILSSLPKIDIYTGLRLKPSHFSQEHIIPKRFFPNRTHSDDILNLAPCDRQINMARSDLKFGECPLLINSTHTILKLLHVNNLTNPIGAIDQRRRTFYPLSYSDKGLIARSIIKMLYKYPYLYCHLHDIIDTDTLWKWYSENPILSIYEQERNLYLKKKDFLKTNETHPNM